MGANDNRPVETESGSKSKENGSSSTGSTTGAGGGRRGSGSTGKTEETKSPRPVLVDAPGADKEKSEEEKKEEKRAKDAARKREQRAKAKANGTATAKKSTPRNQKKNAAAAMDVLQIKALLMTVSQLAASRPGMEVWALSEREADAIVEPLTNIMAKSNAMDAIGEHNDAFALAIACFTIFIPKFMIWNATRPKKKKEDNTHVKVGQSINTGGSTGQQTGTTTNRNGTTGGQSASNSTTFSGELHAHIPASIGI